jgi:serine phosphatase RsbU (regulator of sigma subunit)
MLNTRTVGRSQGGFTTCLIARVDAAGRGTVASAGHLPPYLSGKEIPVVNDLPLGLNAASTYTETEFRLEAGDQLTLLTDGIAEARSKTGELFGFERTASVAVLSASDAVSQAQQFGQEDDITVVTLARKTAEEEFAVQASRLAPLT